MTTLKKYFAPLEHFLRTPSPMMGTKRLEIRTGSIPGTLKHSHKAGEEEPKNLQMTKLESEVRSIS
jgi:hypothetical protein